MRAMQFRKKRLFYIDQRLLPQQEKWRECKTVKEGLYAIKALSVRGAPLIGVFAAYCVYIEIKKYKGNDAVKFIKECRKIIAYLKKSRPTAVNLFWALARMEDVLKRNRNKKVKVLKDMLRKAAEKIHREDELLCRKMAQAGVSLIKKGDTVLTHCNAGFLATSGDGTAVAVLYEAKRKKKNIKVYVDETRPLLQGARLTAWELMKAKVDATLISDNMAASLMQKGLIDKVFVGADRIAANGDAANKIGTYNVAVLAKHHKVPFYIVAPHSTFDLAIKTGKDIPIEERNPDEVRKVIGKVSIAPKNIKVYNPAFDVTPHSLITAIVTDKGVIRAPYVKNIRKRIKR